jgi:hypothetical protein
MKFATGLIALTLLAAPALFPVTAHAQADNVPIRIEGVWDPAADNKSVLTTLSMYAAKQHTKRSFGVTSVQTMDAATAGTGVDVFQQAEINPSIVVYGRDNEISSFFAAPAGKKVQVLAIYWLNNGDLILGSVKFPK